MPYHWEKDRDYLYYLDLYASKPRSPWSNWPNTHPIRLAFLGTHSCAPSLSALSAALNQSKELIARLRREAGEVRRNSTGDDTYIV